MKTSKFFLAAFVFVSSLLTFVSANAMTPVPASPGGGKDDGGSSLPINDYVSFLLGVAVAIGCVVLYRKFKKAEIQKNN